jgi:hypothetical protein
MNRPFRKVYSVDHVEQATTDVALFKYMSLWKLESLLSDGLYFCRIDAFIDDDCEGTIPRDVWSLNHPLMQAWYAECRQEVFVCCWNLDEPEVPTLWKRYAGSCGVRLELDVGALAEKLTTPRLPAPEPYSPEIERMLARSSAVAVEPETPHDGFTIGRIRYLDFDNVDVHELLSEGVSSAIPAFRKRDLPHFLEENEFRLILRSRSVSGVSAKEAGRTGVMFPIDCRKVIREIRYTQGERQLAREYVRMLMDRHGLDVPLVPSTVSEIPHDLPHEQIVAPAYDIWDPDDARRHGHDKRHWFQALECQLFGRSRTRPW